MTLSSKRGTPFQEVSRHFEKELMKNMEALNIRQADFVARVSEYVPDIIDYIQTIIGNGFAYEDAGSAYFDTAAFVDCGHNYGKLEPWSVGKTELIAEGEGIISAEDESLVSQKRALNEFALWKKSKVGEPSWPSPWDPARPEWHIECSAMPFNILGSTIDIHAGGVDLRFPHPSNEIA